MVITALTDNPFSDYGGIVGPTRFVGREEEIFAIENRILGTHYGNLAIMGLPRVGKSSLAWTAIMGKKDQLLREKTIPVFLTVGSFKTSTDLFKSMVARVHDELELLGMEERLQKLTQKITGSLYHHSLEPVEIVNLVEKYFRLLKRSGYKVILVLDEFDSTENHFDFTDFQTLRELSTKPETKVCLVTISRKTIQEIESINGAISNFYGTFSDIRLGLFNPKDMQLYWKRIEKYGIRINDVYKEKIEYFVGRHPFLLDLFNDETFKYEKLRLKRIDSGSHPDVDRKIQLELLHFFENMLDTLKKEKLVDKAIQLIVGPVYDVSAMDEEKLLRYQFIKKTAASDKQKLFGRMIGPQIEDAAYLCFSAYFSRLIEHQFVTNIDYWPLWAETERKIRNLIKTYLTSAYSSDWETEIRKKFEKNVEWTEKFTTLQTIRASNKKLFVDASDNLIDYTLTRNMYDLFISNAWGDFFEKVFQGNKKDWAKIFKFLSDIRNPMAHNNKEFISADQLATAKCYCDKILKRIGVWENAPDSLR